MLSIELGSYRLVEKIGRGSAGTVFVGEFGALRRPFAIKVLHEHLVTDGSADRMIAEARALSVLDHPGIVRVHDCGMTDDGRAYIAMEYLTGEQLHQRLRRGPLSEQQVVMFARQLASALEVAHAAGIIHRDVKPENAFVVLDPDVPGGERIKLLDFGIAKCGDQERTDTGVVLGTPAYMAPEQFAASRRVNHRVDIYALGVVMYAMATGTLPFVGSDTDELRAEHSYCLQRPATESGVSHLLSEIIDCCLAKHPDERFASMAQLGAALHELELLGMSERASSAHLSALEVELDEVETAALVCNLDVRRRLPRRTAIGVVAVIAIALGYVRMQGGDSEAAKPRVVEQEPVLAREDPAPSNRGTAGRATHGGRADSRGSRKATHHEEVRAESRRARARSKLEAKHQRSRLGRRRRRTMRLSLHLRSISAAFAWIVLTHSSAIATPPDDGSGLVTYRETVDRGTAAFVARRFAEARQAFEEAFSIHPDPVLVFNIASCWRRDGQNEEALAEYRRFLTLAPSDDAPRMLAEETESRRSRQNHHRPARCRALPIRGSVPRPARSIWRPIGLATTGVGARGPDRRGRRARAVRSSSRPSVDDRRESRRAARWIVRQRDGRRDRTNDSSAPTTGRQLRPAAAQNGERSCSAPRVRS